MINSQKKKDALEIAQRIRVTGDIKGTRRWLISAAAPVLLIVGLILDPVNIVPACVLLIGNFANFFFRMWSWTKASKSLELLVLPLGGALVVGILYFLIANSRFEWISLLWLVGAFFTPMLVMRTATVTKVNSIADELERFAAK